MTKINWKVRLKNPVFWLTAIPSLVALVYTVLGLLDIAPPVSESEVVQMSSAFIALLTTLGVLVDPTTKGVSDSEQAMTYDKPKGKDN